MEDFISTYVLKQIVRLRRECSPRLPHQRSREKYFQSQLKNQQRQARQYVLNTAYHDLILHESVCLKSKVEVVEALQSSNEFVVWAASDFSRGEVLTDTRGRGSLQVFTQQ